MRRIGFRAYLAGQGMRYLIPFGERLEHLQLRESNNFTASMEQLTFFRGHTLQSGLELVDDPPVARQVWHGIL